MVVLNQRERKKFRAIVRELSNRKAHKLLALVGNSRGNVPKLRKRWREKRIDELQALLEQAHLPELRKWVRRNTRCVEVRFSNHFAKDQKAYEVRDRVQERYGKLRNVVYVSFRRGRKCLKVGKSNRGLGRIASQADHYYFRDANRVRVYFLKRRKKRGLPALECVMTHLFTPVHFYVWPEHKSYFEECPVCKDMKAAKRYVRQLYPM